MVSNTQRIQELERRIGELDGLDERVRDLAPNNQNSGPTVTQQQVASLAQDYANLLARVAAIERRDAATGTSGDKRTPESSCSSKSDAATGKKPLKCWLCQGPHRAAACPHKSKLSAIKASIAQEEQGRGEEDEDEDCAHMSAQDILVWKDSQDGSERVKLFLWKVERDILPYGQRLHCLFGNSSFCVLCDGDVDSLAHLFFHCPVACWFRSSWGVFGVISFTSGPRGTLWNGSSALLLLTVLTQINSPFLRLNSCDLRNRDDPPPLVQCDSLSSVDLGLGNQVNIFVDGTVRDNVSFYAVLVLDYSGKVLEAFAGKENVVSSLDDEARAILNAISRCLPCGWSGAMIFFQIVKWRWMRFWLGRSFLGGFILFFCNCLTLFDNGTSCNVCWISSVNNGATHKLAARAASQSFFGFFDQSIVYSVL
ncbi:hypothetical protein G4B88_011262 [Cannabis sativa]|uniref:Reverse transcriptase zinc-binding domain-containing protein n=1 Tax=Cannabis sativa TaxID=3483 RepID=A0A7J6DP94_CANSA|nr:hypothetical protein G4B88_011262 [Cannabis sativa]